MQQRLKSSSELMFLGISKSKNQIDTFCLRLPRDGFSPIVKNYQFKYIGRSLRTVESGVGLLEALNHVG